MSPWVPRDSAAEYSLGGQLWIAGGWEDSFRPALRDVWSSVDGASWARQLVDAPWEHADLAASSVHRDRMWLMGGWANGRLPGASATNEVWSSAEGVLWQLHAVPGWDPRLGAASASFAGRLWLVGGVTEYFSGDARSLRNDVWSTVDGSEWVRARDQAPWAPRAFHQLVAHEGRLYLLGGGNYLPEYQARNDVWSTSDGVDWRLETATAPWPPRIWFSAVSYRGYLWVLGGWSNNPYMNLGDVWYSRDGRNWARYDAGAQWTPRHEHSAFLHADHIWVAGGFSGVLVSDVWRLQLPTDWVGSCAAQ